MIISEPRRRLCGDNVRFSAEVSFDAPAGSLPGELWFEFPASLEPRLSCGSEPFLTALVLAGMTEGRPIRVAGPVSPRLLSGLVKYQEQFGLWKPRRYRMVPIIAEQKAEAGGERGARAMAAFSGGLDSFYTLWRHLPLDGHVPPRRLDHVLFMHGFDIPTGMGPVFAAAARHYGDVLRPFGVELLTGRSNIRDFGLNWEHSHGSALAAAAMFFAPQVGTFVIPSSRTPAPRPKIWGTDPLTDPLLSTEALDVVHDRSDVTRFDKVKAIGGWEPVQRHLRVCWSRPDAEMNCSRCSKCCLTMIQLDILGLLPRYATFLPPDRRAYRRVRFDLPHQLRCGYEMLGAASQAERKDMMYDVFCAIVRSRMHYRLVQQPAAVLAERMHVVRKLFHRLRQSYGNSAREN